MDAKELEAALLEQIQMLEGRPPPMPAAPVYRPLAPAAQSFAANMPSIDMAAAFASVIPEPLCEQDRLLPIANVSRLMSMHIPKGAKISKNTKQLMQDLVTEFICFVTAEANDIALENHCRAVQPGHIFTALHGLDLSIFAPCLEVAHEHIQQKIALRRSAADPDEDWGSASTSSASSSFNRGSFNRGMVKPRDQQ